MKNKSPPPYRCKDTIDLEEAIAMKMKNEDFKNIKAVVYYKSGRTEEFQGKLKTDGTPYATFNQNVSLHKSFPTVLKVEVIRY